MEALRMDIQLVIRAPNQNVEDHVVHCSLDWTVKKLKSHLAEVYPIKPVENEQKLIYSGRLLHNDLRLRDILRHEDGNSTVHILHLVCSGKSSPNNQDQPPSSSQNWSNQPFLPPADPPLNTPPTESFPGTSENILRHRVIPQASPVSSVYQQAYPGYPQVPPTPGDPQFFTHMTAMQQMYAYYFTQYMQSMNVAVMLGNVAPTQDFSDHPNNANQVQNENGQQRPNNLANPMMDDNDELANRDWLDHFFAVGRLIILFSIVYFYSTPERLMTVIVLAIVAFLYHEGWFVRRQAPANAVNQQQNRQNRNNANASQRPENIANAQPHDDLNASANNADVQDGAELEAAMDGDNPPHVQNQEVANNNVLSPLTFISAFFSSLVPEPPPPVNIN